MMRSFHAHNQNRQPTSSQDLQRTKKLGLTSSNSKNKINSSFISPTPSSLKKSSLQSSIKSTKKSGFSKFSNSTSNKSLKGLKQITPNSNLQVKKSTQVMKQLNKQAKRTIPIKNIKQKICGSSTNQNILNITNHKNIDKDLSIYDKQLSNKNINHNKHYYFNKDNKRDDTRDTRETKKNMDFTHQYQQYQQNYHQHTILCLEQFQMGRKLGKGRFGDVYMARDKLTGFVLAIKVINKKQLKESQMQNQLIQQIKIQMFCSHPNILKMYSFFSDPSKIYLLLQVSTSGCLFKQIRKSNNLSENLSSFYLRQITSGIRYLHSNHIIHRDIKPQNILNCFNVLKLADFGWAIYSPLYQRQTFCGTLDYVPPQIVKGEFYDQKADLWCLGVLCYQLATGKAPFQSKTDQNQTYDKILNVNIQFPIYLSQQIVDIIGKILTRDPTKRLDLQAIENHQWMRMYENEAGRMISKEIWDKWIQLTKTN